MTNNDIRKMIEDFCFDSEVLNKVILLEGDEFADGCIGFTPDFRIVYSYDRLVKSLAATMPNDTEDREAAAAEWIDYNTFPTVAALEAHGMLAPIIIREF